MAGMKCNFFVRLCALTVCMSIGLQPALAIQPAQENFDKVSNLTATYNEDTEKLVVRWDAVSQAEKYKVRVRFADETILSGTTTDTVKRFDVDELVEDHTYTVQVRVQAKGTILVSRWKSVEYVHNVDEAGTACDMRGIEHEIYTTSSNDPLSFPAADERTLRRASVPDAIQLRQTTNAGDEGDLLVYFVRQQLCMIRSSDNGETWSTPTNVDVLGMRNKGGAVDPSLVQLADGTLRMYFFGTEITSGDPAQQIGKHAMYSATSEDGLTFTTEKGKRLSLASITDPEVIKFNGRWYMYVSNGNITKMAKSSDGLDFTLKDQIWYGGGIPGAYVQDDQVYLYGCSGSNIQAGVSTNGLDFNIESTSVISGATGTCDPSPVLLSSGSVFMVYKIQTATTK